MWWRGFGINTQGFESFDLTMPENVKVVNNPGRFTYRLWTAIVKESDVQPRSEYFYISQQHRTTSKQDAVALVP